MNKTKRPRQKKRLSLRFKVTALSACILTAAAVSLSLASMLNAQQTLNAQQNDFENFLFATEVSVASVVPEPPGGTPETYTVSEPVQPDSTPAVSAPSSAVISVTAEDDTLNSITLQPEADPSGTAPAISMKELLPADTVQFQQFTVTATHRFRYLNYIVMAVILILGILLTYFLLGHALQPVKKLSRDIQAIDENNLDQRLENHYTSSEIRDLAHSFNSMMARLSEAFALQKRFAAAAAHELKTPLACMRSNIDVLELDEHPTLQEYREVIAITKRNTERMTALVEQLLEMAGTDAAVPSVALELAPVVIEAVDELTPLAQKEGISISCSGNGTALVNRMALSRILNNLIENAIKYNEPNGKIEIRIWEEEGRACIAVSDTGIGIDRKEKEKIFEPFYRADSSRSRASGGAGLGLALVKELALASRGNIAVTDNVPHGSVFTLSLSRDSDGESL